MTPMDVAAFLHCVEAPDEAGSFGVADSIEKRRQSVRCGGRDSTSSM